MSLTDDNPRSSAICAEKREAPLILIVDDDVGLLRLIEKALRRSGCRVAVAASGQEAVAWLSENQADLLLMDLRLPDLSGQDLVEELRRRRRLLPFVVITGQGDERVAVAMMKMGAADYLVKDREFLDLLPMLVERVLNQIEREEKLRAAEESLRREHAFSSAILDTSGALVVALDREGRIVRFNRTCEQVTGYEFAEVEGRVFWDIFLAPEEVADVLRVFEDLRAGRFTNRNENYWITRSGDRRLIAWSNTALKNDDGQVRHIVSAGIDITEHKRLEKEVLEISEMEQRRIGQDLHDGLCQHLAGIEFMSQVLEQRLAQKVPAEAAHAGEIASLVRQAIGQTRDLARGLSPVSLESEGLMSALQVLAETTERIFQIECRFLRAAEVLVEDPAIKSHLFRIAQEAVSNALKHGRARRVQIELTRQGERIILSVDDDGSGMPRTLSESTGMGLRIMQYRAGMIGGTVAFGTSRLGGVSVVCSVRFPAGSPVESAAHDTKKRRSRRKRTAKNSSR